MLRRKPQQKCSPEPFLSGDLMDWEGLMRLGLQQMGLKPIDFWALTPHELQVMAGLSTISPRMGRDRLAELVRVYPDMNGGEDD